MFELISIFVTIQFIPATMSCCTRIMIAAWSEIIPVAETCYDKPVVYIYFASVRSPVGSRRKGVV